MPTGCDSISLQDNFDVFGYFPTVPEIFPRPSSAKAVRLNIATKLHYHIIFTTRVRLQYFIFRGVFFQLLAFRNNRGFRYLETFPVNFQGRIPCRAEGFRATHTHSILSTLYKLYHLCEQRSIIHLWTYHFSKIINRKQKKNEKCI